MVKKYFKNLIFYIIYIIVLLITKIPRLKKFQLVELNASRVSNLVMETEIFDRKINSNKIYLIFFYKIANKYFIKLFLKKVRQNKKVIILPGYVFWKIACDAFFYFSNKKLQYKIKNLRKKYSTLIKEKSYLSIPYADTEKGYEIIKKYGIKKDSKWICIYNRDSTYLNNFLRDKSWEYHDYRNFPIQDLKKTVNYFIEKNYFVIRVGSLSEGKLNISNNRYFDYSNSDIKSDFMDCFLLSKCEMFFGGSSGICLLPASFRKPYFLINNCPLEGIFSIKRNYPAIFKRIKNLKTNKILSIKEMIDRDLCNTFTSEEFKIKNVINLNNSEQEIKEFAIEALNILECQKKNRDDVYEQQMKKSFETEIIRDPFIKNLEYKNLIGYDFLKKTIIN